MKLDGSVVNIPILGSLAAYSIDPDATETLTQETWRDLVDTALQLSTPLYMLGVHRLKSGGVNFYDGIALYKHRLANPSAKDPLTNLPVEKVNYLFLKTFDLTEDGLEQEIVSNDLVFTEPPDDFSSLPRLDIPFSAMDIHALLNTDPIHHATVATCQLIFSADLMTHESHSINMEGFRMLLCAGKNGNREAAGYLSTFYRKGVIVRENEAEAQKWADIAQK